ncbi:MAG: hypothetical protein LC734_09110 [Acidobacteria bacterium]|nr:hypothetical protein [Acidobacteriota bacterium]
MKIKHILLCIAVLTSVVGFAHLSHVSGSADERNLKLLLSSSKIAYFNGEIVNLTFRLLNTGTTEHTVRHGLFAEDGYVSIYISKDGVEFAKYRNPNWGRFEGSRGPFKIGAGASLEASADILWNSKPDVGHLNPMAAQRASDGKILTDYVFPEPGNYWVKASFSDFDKNSKRIAVESEPIPITIIEPAGDDLEAWRKIKNRPEIAFFIQEAKFRMSLEPSERQRLKQEIETIANQHPHSVIAKQIRRSLQRLEKMSTPIPRN